MLYYLFSWFDLFWVLPLLLVELLNLVRKSGLHASNKAAHLTLAALLVFLLSYGLLLWQVFPLALLLRLYASAYVVLILRHLLRYGSMGTTSIPSLFIGPIQEVIQLFRHQKSR